MTLIKEFLFTAVNYMPDFTLFGPTEWRADKDETNASFTTGFSANPLSSSGP